MRKNEMRLQDIIKETKNAFGRRYVMTNFNDEFQIWYLDDDGQFSIHKRKLNESEANRIFSEI